MYCIFVFWGNSSTLHVVARVLGIEPQYRTNTIWFRWRAEFTGSGQRAADKHFCVSKITGVGGKQAASYGTLPWFSLSPSPTARRHRGEERGGENKITEENLKEGREREERQGGERERDSTRWIMQSCQRWLLLEVLAALKGSRADLHQLHSHHSPWLRVVWSVLRQTANQMREGRGRRGLGHLATGGLS